MAAFVDRFPIQKSCLFRSPSRCQESVLSMREDETMDVGGGALGDAFQEDDGEDSSTSADDESENTSMSSSAKEESEDKAKQTKLGKM